MRCFREYEKRSNSSSSRRPRRRSTCCASGLVDVDAPGGRDAAQEGARLLRVRAVRHHAGNIIIIERKSRGALLKSTHSQLIFPARRTVRAMHCVLEPGVLYLNARLASGRKTLAHLAGAEGWPSKRSGCRHGGTSLKSSARSTSRTHKSSSAGRRVRQEPLPAVCSALESNLLYSRPADAKLSSEVAGRAVALGLRSLDKKLPQTRTQTMKPSMFPCCWC